MCVRFDAPCGVTLQFYAFTNAFLKLNSRKYWHCTCEGKKLVLFLERRGEREDQIDASHISKVYFFKKF